MYVSFAALFAAAVVNPPENSMLETPAFTSLHAVSDVLIALLYYAMAALVMVYTRKRPDQPFHRLLVALGGAFVICVTAQIAMVGAIGTPWLGSRGDPPWSLMP